MTQEQKDLLLKDLCARLPYGVMYETYEGVATVGMIDYEYINDRYLIHSIKPYLRPMSSMTEEEKQEYHVQCDAITEFDADGMSRIFYYDTIESIDWLNAHHFDYRGLIGQGLAIEVIEEDNPYKNQ